MKNMVLSFNTFFGIMSLLFFLSSCDTGGTDIAWTEPSFKDLVAEYHDNSIGDLANPKSGKKSIYIDVSDCIVEALKTPLHAATIKDIAFEFTPDETAVEFYGLGRNNYGGIGIITGSSSDRYMRITKPQKDIYAPIDSALMRMASSKNDGLLISDFELLKEINGKLTEDFSNFAENNFKTWLNGGNSITIYFGAYNEKGSSKNLYYLFFNHGSISPNSMVFQFEKLSSVQGLTKIEMNPNTYKVINEYGGNTMTGLTPDEPQTTDLKLNDNAGVLNSFQNGFIGSTPKPFEALDFQMDLTSLYETYFKEKNRFLQKVFLNSKSTASYSLKGVDVQVYDVSDDFIHYSHCKEAKSHVPTLTKDEGNQSVWDEKTSNDPISVECFEPNTQDLKVDYKYATKASEPLAEYFQLDKSIFGQHLQNSPDKVELRTNFHPQFQNASVDNSIDKIMRIDLVVTEVEPSVNPDLEKLKWNSIINKGKINESLYESITKVIRDHSPKGRRLYSYYVKFSAKQ